MKISVALCTYNGEEFLEDQLGTILRQTRRADEIILSDDGSQDSTMNIVRNLLPDSNRELRIFSNEKNIGSTKNFEATIKSCTGDIIVLADQDDLWHPEKLACIEKMFSENPAIDALFSNGSRINERGESLGKNIWDVVGFTPAKKAAVRAGHGFDALLFGNFVTGATLAFRGHCRDLILPIPQDWIHDYWIAVMIAAGSKLDFIDELLIQYRCHSKQQVGVPRGDARNLNELWRRFVELDADAYMKMVGSIAEIRARLASQNEGQYSKAIDKCDAMSAHLQKRANLPVQKWRRLPIICEELLRGHYFLHSLGMRSVLRDCFANLSRS